MLKFNVRWEWPKQRNRYQVTTPDSRLAPKDALNKLNIFVALIPPRCVKGGNIPIYI